VRLPQIQKDPDCKVNQRFHPLHVNW
jgi:hypothetical protein